LTGGFLTATVSIDSEEWRPNGEWEAVVAVTDSANKSLYSCASFRFWENFSTDLDSNIYIGPPEFDITGSKRRRRSLKAAGPERVASNFTDPSIATLEPDGATLGEDESPNEELLCSEERKELSCSDGNETAPDKHPNEQPRSFGDWTDSLTKKSLP